MKRFCILTMLVALLASVSVAFAAPAFYEGFDYAAGSNINNQGGWLPWSPYKSYVAESTGATYTDAAGNKLAVSGKSVYQEVTGSQYVLTKHNLPQTVTDLFATGGTFYITLMLKEQGNFVFNSSSKSIDFGTYSMTTDFYQPRLEAAGKAAVRPYGNHYWNGTQYDFYAMKIVNNAAAGALDQITVLRNPDLLNPNWDDTESNYRIYQDQADITASDYTYFHVFGMGGMGGSEQVGGMDEIRIASNWADAAPVQPVPEPATITVLAMGCASLIMRRRRA